MRTNLTLYATLWQRFAWRHWLSAPGQYLLLVSIISMGVAVFVSIRLANRAAVSGFENFTQVVTGQSDLVISSPAGALAVADLVSLRKALGAEPAHIIPVVEASAVRPRREGESLIGRKAFRIIGIDLVATSNLIDNLDQKRWFSAGQNGEDTAHREQPGLGMEVLFEEIPYVWVSPSLADRERLSTGDTIVLIVDDSRVTLRVAGTVPAGEGLPQPAAHMLVMDLPRLQELQSRTEYVDRAEIVVPRGSNIAERRRAVRTLLETASGGRWEIETPENRRETGEIMTAAFRLNLTVLSLIALLVGLLLIVQAVDGAVIRRRQEIAILRSFGVEASQLRIAWLVESAMIGIIGSSLGVVLGWAGAQVAVRFVAQTVNALYYANTVSAASLQVREFLLAFLIGVVACVIAGWVPSRSAANTPPAQLLGRGHIPSGLAFLAKKRMGVVFLLAGCLLYFLPALRLDGGTRFPLAGYASAFSWILGAGLFAASIFRLVAGLLHKLSLRLAPLRVAVGHLQNPTGRHRLAVCGLVAAIGMTAGMIILVSSFEKTVRGWIGQSLRADLFVASDGVQNASATSRLQAATWRAVLDIPEVAAAEMYQGYRVRIGGLNTILGGFDSAGTIPTASTPWISDPIVPLAEAAKHPAIAYASESFCVRFDVGIGSEVVVPTVSGDRKLTISGVFADYGNELGSILVARNHLATWFGEDRLNNLSLFLKEGADPNAVRDRILESHPALRVLTNAGLRGEILTIFRQTFSITYALELIGVVVAVAGLAFTLASMLLDRRHELTTLRALGLTRNELAGVAAWEGGATTIVGVIGGLLLSAGLGHLLIFVINKQSFGWTLQLAIPWLQLGLLTAGVMVAGIAASWLVGRWGALLPADMEE